MALENCEDSGVGIEKLQFGQSWLWYNMEPFLTREISQACLPKAGLSLGSDKGGAFGRTLPKPISLHSVSERVMSPCTC